VYDLSVSWDWCLSCLSSVSSVTSVCQAFQVCLGCVGCLSLQCLTCLKSPPKNGEIALWLATNGSISKNLVLAGTKSIFIEITEYIYLNLIWTALGFAYTVTQILYHRLLYLDSFCFGEKHILLHISSSWPTRVRFLHSGADRLEAIESYLCMT